MLNFMSVYFYYNINKLKKVFKSNVVKSNGVHDLGHGFDELSHEALVNPTCRCFNIKKRCHLEIF
jgi:hypothetical protein